MNSNSVDDHTMSLAKAEISRRKQMERSQVLLMCLTDPSGDPRPYRTIQLCHNMGIDVYTASKSPQKPIAATSIFSITKEKSGIASKVSKRVLAIAALLAPTDSLKNTINERRHGLKNIRHSLQDKEFELIIVEDLYLLPFAHEIKSTAKVIFDAREYYPEQSSESLLWKVTERFNRIRICRNYLSKCDAVLTVSPGLAEAYKTNFNVDCHLILSVPNYSDSAYKEQATDKIRMIHHGGALKNRKLENMIKLFKYLDSRFELDFYLVGSQGYIKHLKKLAAPYPQIRFLAPVEYSNIGKMLSSYDIGLYLLEPTGFNVLRALPNKFFEFIQARLMLAIGPSPDMAALVKEHKCGVVSDSFNAKDLAEKLNVLTTEQILEYKKNSDSAAKILCWETESHKLASLINSFLALGKKP